MTETAIEERSAAAASQTVRALIGLRKLILGGELKPGSRISELWVAERLNVSRTPIRAGLLRLQDEGLLEPIPSGGFAVRSFTEDEIRDAIELRGTLEGLAARLAAERGAGKSGLHDLWECIGRIDAVLGREMTTESFSCYVDLNERFHRFLAAAAQSSVIERQIEKLMCLPFASACAFVVISPIEEGTREMLRLAQSQHRAVVEAIENREGTRAEALMREHSRIAHRNLRIALEDQRAMIRLPGGPLIRRWGQ